MERTTIFLTKRQLKRLRQLAEIDEVKPAELIRYAIEVYFALRSGDLVENSEEVKTDSEEPLE